MNRNKAFYYSRPNHITNSYFNKKLKKKLNSLKALFFHATATTTDSNEDKYKT